MPRALCIIDGPARSGNLFRCRPHIFSSFLPYYILEENTMENKRIYAKPFY